MAIISLAHVDDDFTQDDIENLIGALYKRRNEIIKSEEISNLDNDFESSSGE